MNGKLYRKNYVEMVIAMAIALVATMSLMTAGAERAEALGVQATQVESQPWCADVLIVGVAGSGQSGYSREVAAAVSHLETQISPQFNVRSIPLNYPAVGMDVLLDDLAHLYSGEWNYFESVGDGHVELVRMLGAASIDCPDEKWILVGYSQGALVINQAAQSLERYADRISGVIMIAEPSRWVRNFNRQNFGNAQPGDGVTRAISAYSANNYPSEFNSFTVDVCMEADVVCDYTNWSLSLIGPHFGKEVHTTIPEILITTAADAILPRALAPRLPTSSSIPHVEGAGSGAVNVSWQPFRELGAPINHYRITLESNGLIKEVRDVSPDTYSLWIGGLPGGAIVIAKVEAVTDIGSGTSAPSIAALVPPTIPQSQFNHIGYLGSTSSTVSIRWAYPPNDGGSPVTEYRIGLKQSYPFVPNSPEAVTMVPGHLNSTVLEGLPPGTHYLLTVNACNIIGCAKDSEHRMVLTFGVIPPPPTDIESSTISADGALISWAAPVEPYPTVSSYRVVLTTGSEEITKTVQAPATSLVVTGLKAGTQYSATVSAENHIGLGEKSTATTFTTLEPPIPGQPEAPVASLTGNSGLEVSWSAPANAGPPITSYEVAWTTDELSGTVLVPAEYTSTTLRHLAGDRSYTVTVAATNDAGTSPASPLSAAVYVPGEMPLSSPPPLSPELVGGSADEGLSVGPSESGSLAVNEQRPQAWYFVSGLRAGSKQEMQAFGWYLSDTKGQIKVTIPEGIKPGNYQIAVQASTGALVGSTPYRWTPSRVPLQS